VIPVTDGEEKAGEVWCNSKGPKLPGQCAEEIEWLAALVVRNNPIRVPYQGEPTNPTGRA
jgi:hypothetical protein